MMSVICLLTRGLHLKRPWIVSSIAAMTRTGGHGKPEKF